MTPGHQLICLAPGEPFKLAVAEAPVPRPAPDQVLVRVEATSVNPIDVKRSQGYGARLLAVRGASTFPLVLGNDLVGTVVDVGAKMRSWSIGDRVMGLINTGPRGAHASYVAANPRYLIAVPPHYSADELAVLPYTFTTLWLALKGVGLNPSAAHGRKVLIAGASGGLGQLALQVLSAWGAKVTAMCSADHAKLCTALGAHAVFDRKRVRIQDLPKQYDATLNFGVWEQDQAMRSRVRPGGLGHATTVHPLLANFDSHGWIKGALTTLSDRRQGHRDMKPKGASAKYVWTVFSPSAEALHALSGLLAKQQIRLPVGISMPLEQAHQAFEHVHHQRAGRAVLRPTATSV